MVQKHFVFNVIIYAIIIAYILYINFAAYLNKTTKFINGLVRLFQNWIFRIIFLLLVGYFALDLFPYGGFTLAVLLTIAFLNTNMLIYKRDVGQGYENYLNLASDEWAQLGEDGNDTPYYSGDLESYANMSGSPYNENVDNDNDAYEQEQDDSENFGNPDSGFDLQRPANCGSYAPLQSLPYNPQGYRPDESVMDSGAPDKIAQSSVGPTEYTTSGVGYEFDMA